LLRSPERGFIGSTKDADAEHEDEPEVAEPNHQVKEEALAVLVSKKAEIDSMLTRIQALSDDHFGYAPEDVTWSHVGTLEHYAELLKRITDMAFNEGEHAA
jgi:hypothetical protein